MQEIVFSYPHRGITAERDELLIELVQVLSQRKDFGKINPTKAVETGALDCRTQQRLLAVLAVQIN